MRRDQKDNARKVEQVLSGLRCSSFKPCGFPGEAPDSARVSLTGSAADLMRHGLVTQQKIDALPPCGSKTFYDENNRGMTLYRNASTYRVSRWYERQELAAMDITLEALTGASKEKVRLGSGLRDRDRRVGRWQRQVRWVAIENVLYVDWREVRNRFSKGMLPERSA